MTTTRGWGKFISIFGLLIFLICYITLLLLIYLEPTAVEGMDLIALIVALSFIFAYIFFARYQIKLQTFEGSQEFMDSGKFLTEDKIRILWNLLDQDSALKARQTFQDPFNQDKKFWDSFFDIKDQKSIIEEIKSIQKRTSKIVSFFLGSFVALMACVGFYVGKFWEFSINQLQTPNEGWILAFLVIFGFMLVVFIIYSTNVRPLTLFVLLLIAGLFAWLDEAIFTFVNLWNYLDGEPISLTFAIFGWPVFIMVIIGFSNWVLKYIRLPEFEGNFGAKILDFLPIFLIICVFGLFFILEGGLSELLVKESNEIVCVSIAIIGTIFLSIIFSLVHSFKQNLVIITVAMIFGGIMEVLGNLCGYWTYFEFNQITPGIPNFLIVFWAFRVLTILLLGEIFRQKIIRPD